MKIPNSCEGKIRENNKCLRVWKGQKQQLVPFHLDTVWLVAWLTQMLFLTSAVSEGTLLMMKDT